MREIKKYNFSKVFDLQNSSRTNFYKNILFPKADKDSLVEFNNNFTR